ncbi:outer envelope pore protein 21, chloroplastic isoform X2 [Vigna angularis]|uniref:outer envelope pore protein 21, chloroplastic isoform X2 n=1 Tax=Phaseolus angularis TaxID=3914 RepID=UPI0022B442C7|nr:outer envelope pore protein 21, chloroplastic isoform X2 [Vigna angularis]
MSTSVNGYRHPLKILNFIRKTKMETYLRYREDFKALPIHAKEKLRINSNTYVQMNGELDTKVGQLTSSSSILIKHLYSNLSSILGVRLRHCEKFCYIVNAKTMILVPVSILKGSSEVDREFKELPNVLNFEIKGACDVDREFKEKKSRVAVELLLNLFNFIMDILIINRFKFFILTWWCQECFGDSRVLCCDNRVLNTTLSDTKEEER